MTDVHGGADNPGMGIAHWPLYGLRLRTPRLELRLPALEELDALAQLAANGVHDPETMPFGVPWTDRPPAERARGVMQYHWRTLAGWTPEDWELQLVVFLDGVVVGTQSISARDFPITRQVITGSWLGLRYHGQGIGTEMRAAAAHLAFAGLDAQSAVSEAMTHNPASAAISRKLGYQANGLDRVRVRDGVGHSQRFALDRERWQQCRTVLVEIEGLRSCLPQFGLQGA
jgi:RimJ/RimL family protein N-acetyltransferase